jgi:GNAT superfamily N-acetyltransferase
MSIHVAKRSDLVCINEVIAEAVMAWPMAERLKRLSVPVLCYDCEDFNHYQFILYKDQGATVGIGAWNAQVTVVTARGDGRLLHGLYILPAYQGMGFGQRLMEQILTEAMAIGADGLQIKAERPAITFFEHCGLHALSAGSPTDYPYQFWYQLN